MILNAYAVLDVSLSLLRLGLGLLVVGLAVLAGWAWVRRAPAADARTGLEDRCYLLFLLAALLVGLNAASWPVLYLVLQSYVAEWPQVMCIYGVTRIGAGTLGPSRFLPALVTALQVTKPALVFLGGAWFVLYLVNRRTRTAPLTGRVLAVLLACGLLGVGDAAAEVAYLTIPKKEVFPSGGCCTEAFDAKSRAALLLPGGWAEDDAAPRLYAAYYAVNAGLVLAVGGCALRFRRRFSRRWLAPLLAGAGLCLVVSAVFLVEVGAPRLLHLPYHHCPYDLVPQAPESLVAVALFLVGTFSVGWACTAGWLGGRGEAALFVPGIVGRLLHLGFSAYLASLVMMSVELLLA
jgi:hypothetical protein